jgi:hypothetical protein
VLDRFLELFRVTLCADLSPRQWVAYEEVWEEPRESLGFGEADVRRGSWLSAPTIGAAEIDSLRYRWPSWINRPQYFDAALEHFEDALFSMEPADTVAHTIMSFESLVTDGVPRTIKRKTLVTRASRLMGTSDIRGTLGGHLGTLYGSVRNGKAHSDPLSDRTQALRELAQASGENEESLAIELLRATSKGILEMHERLRRNDATIDEILAQLDDQ